MCLGIPGRIVEITDPEKMLATVDVLGVRRQINVACILSNDEEIEALIGVWTLVHVGFAMSRIDEKEAAETLELLHQLGETQGEIEAMRTSERTLAS